MWEEGFILIFRATEYYGDYFKLNKRPLRQIFKKQRPNKPRCFSDQIENVKSFLKNDMIFFKFEFGLI